MDETTKLLMKLVEENARYKAALEYLRLKYEKDKSKGYESTDVGVALGFAGILKPEVDVIQLDNCNESVYREEIKE